MLVVTGMLWTCQPEGLPGGAGGCPPPRTTSLEGLRSEDSQEGVWRPGCARLLRELPWRPFRPSCVCNCFLWPRKEGISFLCYPRWAGDGVSQAFMVRIPRKAAFPVSGTGISKTLSLLSCYETVVPGRSGRGAGVPFTQGPRSGRSRPALLAEESMVPRARRVSSVPWAAPSQNVRRLPITPDVEGNPDLRASSALAPLPSLPHVKMAFGLNFSFCLRVGSS